MFLTNVNSYIRYIEYALLICSYKEQTAYYRDLVDSLWDEYLKCKGITYEKENKKGET